MEYYGNATRGKDGRNYKSQFEADFCNKFLYQKYSYEYEKPYNDGSRRKSDFYLNDLDLYIKCPDGELIYYVKRKAKNGGQLDIDRNVHNKIKTLNPKISK